MGTPPPTPVERLEARINILETRLNDALGYLAEHEQHIRNLTLHNTSSPELRKGLAAQWNERPTRPGRQGREAA